MSKYDEYIVSYFQQYKTLAIEKIGILEKGAQLDSEQNTQPTGWSFVYDKKAKTSEEFIQLIAEQTSKNKMLISADVSSYFDQAREFINTGKAFEISGAGFIKNTTVGVYQLVSYESIGEVIKKVKPAEGSSQKKTTKSKTGEKAAGIVSFFIIGIILAGMGWGIYQYFFAENKTNQTVDNADVENTTDTSTASPTASVQNNSVTNAVINEGDSVLFKFVIETTPNNVRAASRTAQLKSFGNAANFDSITTSAGLTTFHIYIQKKATIADTAAISDSLSRFFIPKGSNKKIIIKQ